jgi:predicted RNA-binding protein with PUA-like domain
MKSGDLVFFYHSGDKKSVVGLARVAKESYPDPTTDEGDWWAVDVAPVKSLTQPVALSQIKADKILKGMVLVKQSRLSVMPVTREQFTRLLELSGTKV